MKYFNNVTGESFSLEELKEAFEDVREDIEETSFEDWLDSQITAGRNGMDGLVPYDYEIIYWLDLVDDEYTLYKKPDDEVCSGKLSDIGIEENDPNFSNKLDDFFEKELGIAPYEWEIG